MAEVKQLPKRDEVPVELTWDLEKIFKDEAAFQKAFDDVAAKAKAFSQ